MEILTKENLVRAKSAPTVVSQDFHSLTMGNQVSFVRILFSHPESDGKIVRRWGRGSNRDPDTRLPTRADLFSILQGLPEKVPRNIPRRCPRKCARKCPVKWSVFIWSVSAQPRYVRSWALPLSIECRAREVQCLNLREGRVKVRILLF